MLYKVLVVDDEPMIRDGLRTLIDWESLGFQVADTAANGNEALRKVETIKPDLLVMDIRMPGITGLEVIEALRKQGDSLHIIILSGYADFEYAKKAISYQIDGYLLKPIDEDELAEYLTELKSKLDSESEAKLTAGAIGEWSRERVIQSLLAGGNPSAAYDGSRAAEAGLIWDQYGLLLIRLIGRDSEIEPEQAARVKRQLFHLFEDTGRGAVFSMEPYIGVLLREGLHYEQARKTMYKEIASIVTPPGIEFAAAYGGDATSLPDIGACFAEASRLLHLRFFYEGDQIITLETQRIAKPEPSRTGVEDSPDLSAETDKLYFAIDIGNFEAVAQLASEFGRRLIRAGRSEQEIKAYFTQIVTTVTGKLALAEPDLQAKSPHLSSGGIVEIYKLSPYSALERHIIRTLHGFINGSATGGTDKLIKKMIDLIHRNYYENLKLETLADVFNYNSAYLGKLFKSTTGEYFNTYVDKVRIEKAKEFLEQGMKVYQVAEKVGYTNVDYFHSKFRKYVGSSPSSYRNKH